MSKIVISIEYAGLQLQVAKNEQGEAVTPLKPISDLFGLRWEQQREKVTGSEHLRRFLGVCTLTLWGAGDQKREQTCILLSRVAAFLMSINPDLVRAKGNSSGADFLEQKLTEWADALHDYEELGMAVNLNHARNQDAIRRQREAFARMVGVKNQTASPADRQALTHIVQQMAGELGIPYQLDLNS
ncbi:phage antirepressor N-terminal domain-containing protein [Azotobacter vinelandii]